MGHGWEAGLTGRALPPPPPRATHAASGDFPAPRSLSRFDLYDSFATLSGTRPVCRLPVCYEITGLSSNPGTEESDPGAFKAITGHFKAFGGLFKAATGLFKAVSDLFRIATGLCKTATGLCKAVSGLFKIASGLFIMATGLFKASTGLFDGAAGLCKMAREQRSRPPGPSVRMDSPIILAARP
jgi:hypothetical protein